MPSSRSIGDVHVVCHVGGGDVAATVDGAPGRGAEPEWAGRRQAWAAAGIENPRTVVTTTSTTAIAHAARARR
ncbi:MAG: hypothetical protein M0Z93_07680 [Actinomycetota bacterium]|nr:hypothetical protein [Actinomycetota bacterium]